MFRDLEKETFEESFKELSLLSLAKRRPRSDRERPAGLRSPAG